MTGDYHVWFFEKGIDTSIFRLKQLELFQRDWLIITDT
jgi:hypothetical protein